jgi:D-3-phosphoglycerate dehydrogenase
MSSVAVTSRSFSKHPVLRSEILKLYSNVKFNDDGLSLSGDSLVKFLKGYEKAIIALEVIDDKIISQLPELKVISKYGVGLDMIDLNAMKRHGVKLGWTGGVNKRSVSELVISFAISLLHRVVFANSEVKNGKWYQVRGKQLTDCTVGIIGCGNIGKDVVKLLQPFNCKIIVNDIKEFREFYEKYSLTPVTLNELLKTSDVVTLHLPLDNSTKYILNKKNLKLLKKDSVLINLARGGLIDEIELKNMLIEKKLAGVALDVLEQEPPSDRELLSIENVLVTPHIGGSTEEAIVKMGMSAIMGLRFNKEADLYK